MKRTSGKNKLLIFITGLLLCNMAWAQTPMLSIEDSDQPLKAGSSLQVLIDSNGTMTFEQVREANGFFISGKEIPSFAYNDKPVWYKGTFVNKAARENFIINVANPVLDEVDFYYPD